MRFKTLCFIHIEQSSVCRFDSMRCYCSQRTDVTSYSVPHTCSSLTIVVDHINWSGRFVWYSPLLIVVITLVLVIASKRLLRGLMVCVFLPFSGILSVRRHGSVAQSGRIATLVVVPFVFFVFTSTVRRCRIV